MDPEKVDPPADELTDGDLEQVSGGVAASPTPPSKWSSQGAPTGAPSGTGDGLIAGQEYEVKVSAKNPVTVTGPKPAPPSVKLPI